MCVRTKCEQCGKPSYAGCGKHIEQVLGDVPPAERCRCREQAPKARASTQLSWRERLFGK